MLGGLIVLMVENDGKSGPFCPGIPISYSLKPDVSPNVLIQEHLSVN